MLHKIGPFSLTLNQPISDDKKDEKWFDQMSLLAANLLADISEFDKQKFLKARPDKDNTLEIEGFSSPLIAEVKENSNFEKYSDEAGKLFQRYQRNSIKLSKLTCAAMIRRTLQSMQYKQQLEPLDEKYYRDTVEQLNDFLHKTKKKLLAEIFCDVKIDKYTITVDQQQLGNGIKFDNNSIDHLILLIKGLTANDTLIIDFADPEITLQSDPNNESLNLLYSDLFHEKLDIAKNQCALKIIDNALKIIDNLERSGNLMPEKKSEVQQYILKAEDNIREDQLKLANFQHKIRELQKNSLAPSSLRTPNALDRKRTRLPPIPEDSIPKYDSGDSKPSQNSARLFHSPNPNRSQENAATNQQNVPGKDPDKTKRH